MNSMLLRKKAEMIVEAQNSNHTVSIASQQEQMLLHELQVHQIELEMQNEELRREHDALKEAKARYFDLYELAPIGYLTLDKYGKILQANLTATTLFALPKPELINSPLTRFILSDDQDAFYHHTRELMTSSEGQSCELRFARGIELFWARLDSSTILNAQDTLIWHLTLSDITEQKKLQEDLIIAKESCEHEYEAKVEFMCNMSREIRTSLNGVIGLTGIVLESHLESSQREYLVKVLLAANRLLASIDNEESKFIVH